MLFSHHARGARPLPPTAYLGPAGGAKIMCFYVFCCIWGTRGSQNQVFLRILVHLGLVGEPKSRIFTYVAASGPPWATQVVCFCIFCCMGAAFGSTGAVWAILGTPGGLLGAQRGALGRSWGLLGTPWAVLGTILDTFGNHLNPPWGPFGAFWIRLGHRCDS